MIEHLFQNVKLSKSENKKNYEFSAIPFALQHLIILCEVLRYYYIALTCPERGVTYNT